jgi:hypothetical protein
MKSMSRILAVMAAIAGFGISTAVESSAASAQELDEVTVFGSAGHLTELRAAAIAAEDRFYARYNDLNEIDDFDVLCREEARIGTRLRKRNCRGLYEESALRDEGVEAFKIRQFLHDSSNIKIMPSSPPVPALMIIEARRPGFQANMQSVVSGSQELVELLKARAVAVERFEAARRAAFKPESEQAE